MNRRPSLTVLLLAAVAACAFLQAALPLMPVSTGVVLVYGGGAVASLISTWRCAHRARAVRGRVAAGWWTGAGSSVVLAVSYLAGAEQIITNGAMSALTSGGTAAMSLAGFSLMLINAVQLGILARPLRSGLSRITRLLDASAVGAALFALGWQLVVIPALPHKSQVAPVVFLATVLPAILAAAWALVLISNTGSRANGYGLHLLGAAFAVEALSVALLVHDVVGSPGSFGGGAGALSLLPALLRLLATTQDVPEPAHERQNTLSLFWMVLPYLPVVVSLASLAGLYLWHGSIDRLLLWVVFGTVTVAMARQFVSLVIIRYLVVQLDLQRADLDHLAHHDALTGLANRAAFHDRAAAALTGTRPDNMTAMLLLDLDGFKPVNDTYGHATGDAVLVIVAERLVEVVHSRDTASRIGGDEFVILLPHLTDPAEADVVAARIIRRLAEPMIIGATSIDVGASIGIAVATYAEDPLDNIMLQADNALYAAKSSGKNTFRRDLLTPGVPFRDTPAARPEAQHVPA